MNRFNRSNKRFGNQWFVACPITSRLHPKLSLQRKLAAAGAAGAFAAASKPTSRNTKGDFIEMMLAA